MLECPLELEWPSKSLSTETQHSDSSCKTPNALEELLRRKDRQKIFSTNSYFGTKSFFPSKARGPSQRGREKRKKDHLFFKQSRKVTHTTGLNVFFWTGKRIFQHHVLLWVVWCFDFFCKILCYVTDIFCFSPAFLYILIGFAVFLASCVLVWLVGANNWTQKTQKTSEKLWSHTVNRYGAELDLFLSNFIRC